MKSTRIVFLILISVLLTDAFLAVTHISAKANESGIEVSKNMQKTVTAEGIVQKQGMTTYQYGTHVLKDANKKTLYALTSKSQKLDTYVGKKVKITGTLVDGYPVDGGPDYVEVTGVEEIK